MSDHALSDVTVLDLTRFIAGPSCTRLLAEMGARVIKIESAPDGDTARRISKFKHERSLYFVQQNRGKESVCVNLRDPRGLALVCELVARVDVVVENFRPGVMADIGLDYATLKRLKPDIILCSISTLGQSGPLAHLPGYDYIAQAYSGMTSMIGEAGEPPPLPAAAIGDVSTGVHGALAIVAALRHRDRTGRGDHLDVSILDAYYAYHEISVHTASGSGGAIAPTRQGRHLSYLAPCGVFRANGGFAIVMGFMQHWPDLCRALSREDLRSHADFADEPARIANRGKLTELIENWLGGFPDVASAIEHLMRHDVPCAPVLSISETLNHPHLRARGTVRTVVDPIHGPVDLPGMPIKWRELPNNIPLVAPTLGEHNRSVLGGVLGHSAADIDALYAAGVLSERAS
jgi:crotonobetainyl-CoA:carnitine CoA-transferase CaiB-like acyl-CoA transferase